MKMCKCWKSKVFSTDTLSVSKSLFPCVQISWWQEEWMTVKIEVRIKRSFETMMGFIGKNNSLKMLLR